MKRFSFLLLSGLCHFAVFASPDANDSTSVDVNELREVVVETKRSWVEGNKAVFIPTKSEKNLSTDPTSFIESMHLPVVRVIDGKIKSLSGDDVAIYINGVKADRTDLATFWPKKAMRVEYLVNPSDPAYGGARAVVNFVMQQYSFGGVTKVDAHQKFPNNGSYDVSSKLVYKRMTYGLQLKGEYLRDHLQTSSGEESFRNIYYENEFYDEISRLYKSNTWTRSNGLSATFDSRYINGTTQISHTLSLTHTRNPGSGSSYRESWSPTLFDSESSAYSDDGSSISPSLVGNYRLKLSQKAGLIVGWGYAWSRNRRNSYYQMENLDPIVNDVDEDVHQGAISVYPYFTLSDKITLGISIASNLSHFSDTYAGSANIRQNQLRSTSSSMINFIWKPIRGLQFALQPGIDINYWKVGDLDNTLRVEPSARIRATWTLSRSLFIDAALAFNRKSPSASALSSVTIRENELTWLAGNPALRNYSRWAPDISLSWFPCNWFDLSFMGAFSRTNNELITTFQQAPAEMGGVIRKNVNADPLDAVNADIIATGRFFDNKFNVSLQPTWSYYQSHGEYASRQGWFRMRADANYRIGNTRIGIWYGGPEKYIRQGGMVRAWNDDNYGLSFTYGNGDLYLNVSVSNIFESRRHSWTRIGSEFYSSSVNSFNTGRSVSLRLTYTFGYGKKVDRNISISGPARTESGIVGSASSL